MTKTIPLSQGKVTIVDDEDFNKVNALKWCAVRRGGLFYAVHSEYHPLSKGSNPRFITHIILMHRFILDLDGTRLPFVDHINHNGLDNRRCNLRIATNSQNLQNRNLPSNNKTGYKGVTFDKTHKRWKSSIQINGTRMSLGYFDNAKSAARAYDLAAIKYHKEFAFTNFPRSDYE